MKMESNKLILLDSDVISHFVKGGQILLLPQIFQYKKVILDIVFHELKKRKGYELFTENIIRFKLITEIPFPENFEIQREYAHLLRFFGKGESACMAFCKFNHQILASSNIRDVWDYCRNNNITLLTTMDFLAEAYKTGILTEQQCNDFIKTVKEKGSKLPVDSIKVYLSDFNVNTL